MNLCHDFAQHLLLSEASRNIIHVAIYSSCDLSAGDFAILADQCYQFMMYELLMWITEGKNLDTYMYQKTSSTP